MPYKLQKVKGGYKVVSPNGPHSKKPLSKRMALKQLAAIMASTGGK
jgi:hypothetical protein